MVFKRCSLLSPNSSCCTDVDPPALQLRRYSAATDRLTYGKQISRTSERQHSCARWGLAERFFDYALSPVVHAVPGGWLQDFPRVPRILGMADSSIVSEVGEDMRNAVYRYIAPVAH